MKNILDKHVVFWTNKQYVLRVLLSVFLLVLSLAVTFFAKTYANSYSGNVIPDILLDNLPVINVGYIFFQGALVFVLCLVGILLYEPKYIPFTLLSSALFFFIRSTFTVMTHLSAPSVELYTYMQHEHHVQEALFTLSSGNDLFFSGHTGFPFLLACIFWHKKRTRYFFLISSIVGAVAVILGHLHYSIDVFSAFFIGYGVFQIAKELFRAEYKLTVS